MHKWYFYMIEITAAAARKLLSGSVCGATYIDCNGGS